MKRCSVPTGVHHADRARRRCPVHGPEARADLARAVALDRTLPGDEAERRELARTSDDPQILRHFGTRADGALLDALSNPACPADVLERWLGASDRAAATAAARHPSTPERALSRSALRHPDMKVRAAALTNPSTPSEVLSRRGRAGDVSERSAVASNPSIGDVLAAALAADDSWVVRARLAANAACPADILESLARSGERAAMLAALANPGLPDRVRQELASRSADSLAIEHAALGRRALV